MVPLATSLESAEVGQIVCVQWHGKSKLQKIDYADDKRLWVGGKGYWRVNGEKLFLPQAGWSRYPHLEIVKSSD